MILVQEREVERKQVGRGGKWKSEAILGTLKKEKDECQKYNMKRMKCKDGFKINILLCLADKESNDHDVVRCQSKFCCLAKHSSEGCEALSAPPRPPTRSPWQVVSWRTKFCDCATA